MEKNVKQEREVVYVTTAKLFVLSTMVSTALLLSACGNKEETSAEKKEEKPKSEEAAASAPEENKEAEAPAEETPEEAPAEEAEPEVKDGEMLNTYIEEDTGGKAEVLYTNPDPGYEAEGNGFKVTFDGYQIVKVTDADQNTSIRFDDSPTGYVITAQVTVDNQSGKPVFYGGSANIRLQDEFTFVSSSLSNFIKDGEGLRPKGFKPGESGTMNKYEDGEKASGFVTFAMSPAEFEMMNSVKPKFVIESSASPSEDYNGASTFMEEKIFEFTYSDDQAAASEKDVKFYPDLMTVNNLADKEMIFEKTGINKTEKVGDAEITIEGVQYTNVKPTAGNEEQFGEEPLVALTVKMKVKNNSDQTIQLNNLSSKVTIDEDRGYSLNNPFAEPDDPQEAKPGEEKEKYSVFLFRADEFELYKKFDMEVGPFFGGKEYLFNEKTATFSLPR